jgi:hypothetical protein
VSAERGSVEAVRVMTASSGVTFFIQLLSVFGNFRLSNEQV